MAGVEAAAGADPEPGGREGGCDRGRAGPAGEHGSVGALWARAGWRPLAGSDRKSNSRGLDHVESCYLVKQAT